MLWMERGADGARGLGLGGAVVINLCGALVLSAWLLFGDLSLSIMAAAVLWGIVAVLTGSNPGQDTSERI